jgi:hypothetical protein
MLMKNIQMLTVGSLEAVLMLVKTIQMLTVACLDADAGEDYTDAD